MLLSEQVQRQFGRTPLQKPIYASKFYPSAGLGVAGFDLLSVRLGATDPDDPRSPVIATTEEETNINFDGILPFDFVATGLRTELHLLPKARQNSTYAADADGVVGVTWGCMDELRNIMHRGILTLKLNDKVRQEVRQPFINCPPGNGVEIHGVPTSGLANQVNLFWATQSAKAKPYEFPDLLFIPKGTRIGAPLEYPDGAGPALTNAWTGSLTPYLRMRLYIDGFELTN